MGTLVSSVRDQHMQHIQRSTLALILNLAVFYNIERMDLSQDNVVDILTFVYVLVTLGVIGLIALRRFRRWTPTTTILGMTGMYLICRLTIGDVRPLVGGVYTYLTITELVFVALSSWLAHQVALALHDFEQAVAEITLPAGSRQIRYFKDAGEDIQTEMLRSRRHQRPLGVIVVEPHPESVRANVHRTVEEVQRAMMQRYVVRSLSRELSLLLRRTDLVLEQPGLGRCVILSPETSAAGVEILQDKIRHTVLEGLGLAVTCGAAAFPGDALTFEELLLHAETDLRVAEQQPPPAAPAEIEDAISAVEQPAG